MPTPSISPSHLDDQERGALRAAAANGGTLPPRHEGTAPRLAALDLLTRGADGTPRLTRLGEITADRS